MFSCGWVRSENKTLPIFYGGQAEIQNILLVAEDALFTSRENVEAWIKQFLNTSALNPYSTLRMQPHTRSAIPQMAHTIDLSIDPGAILSPFNSLL